jgi:surface antigen
VLAWGGREAGGQSIYSGTTARRLCGSVRWLAVAASVLSSLTSAGCSYRLASLAKDDAEVGSTGSVIRTANGGRRSAPSAPSSEADLAYARAVIPDALARGGKDNSVPWQNPQTGAGGNVTPLETSFNEGGLPCRGFLASYVHGDSHDWLQGAACRTSRGWEVKSLKPLSQS